MHILTSRVAALNTRVQGRARVRAIGAVVLMATMAVSTQPPVQAAVHRVTVALSAKYYFETANFTARQVGKALPSTTVRRIATSECISWLGGANGFLVTGASGREMGRTGAQRTVTVLRTQWVKDRYGEQVFRVSIDCRITGNVTFVDSDWVWFNVMFGDSRGEASPRYTTDLLDRFKKVTASPRYVEPVSRLTWTPAADRPAPALKSVGGSYDKQYQTRTFGLRITNPIYQPSSGGSGPMEWDIKGESSQGEVDVYFSNYQFKGYQVIFTTVERGPYRLTLRVGNSSGGYLYNDITYEYLVREDGSVALQAS